MIRFIKIIDENWNIARKVFRFSEYVLKIIILNKQALKSYLIEILLLSDRRITASNNFL